MNAYPIGNDLTVKWSLLYSDGSVFPLSNYDYELSYRTNRGNKVVTDTSVISVDENILTWTFKGDEQVVSGRYTICLKITLSGSKVVELQYDNAFMLSPLSGFKGAGSEIVLQSYCDAIDLKEAVLQARKAMDIAANAVVDTANSARDAKAAKAAAEVTAAQAKADAESAKTMAADAKDKVAVAEKAATDASRDAVVAQQAAQTASDHITSLQQAIAELPDGQAVTEKVAEHTTKLNELEGKVGGEQEVTGVTWTSGYWNDISHSVSSSSVNSVSDYIDISSFVKVRVVTNYTSSVNNACIGFFNANKEWIANGLYDSGASESTYKEKTYDVPNGAKYMRVSCFTRFLDIWYCFGEIKGLTQEVEILKVKVASLENGLGELKDSIEKYETAISDVTNTPVSQKTLYYQVYTPTSTKWISNNEYYWRLYKVSSGETLVMRKLINKSSVSMAFECPIDSFEVGGSLGLRLIEVDAPIGDYEYVNNGTEDKYVAVLYKYYSYIYFDVLKKVYKSIGDKVEELDTFVRDIRESVYVKATDTNAEILQKMLYAFNKGFCDVFWEKGEYLLSDFYTINLLDEQHQGLPIGNDCRYYFNGSTIKYELPSGAIYARRHILDTQSTDRNLEVYDVNLVNLNGYYGIHDEGGGVNEQNPYTHIYTNVNIYCKNDVLSDSGWKPFGCGVGYDSTLIFRGCVFNRSSSADAEVAIHGVIVENRTTPVKCSVIAENCWFQRTSLQISSRYFNPDIDNLELRICGCSSAYNHVSGGFPSKMWLNEVR